LDLLPDCMRGKPTPDSQRNHHDSVAEEECVLYGKAARKTPGSVAIFTIQRPADARTRVGRIHYAASGVLRKLGFGFEDCKDELRNERFKFGAFLS